MTKSKPLLRTVKETAELLGYSETTVWELIRTGQLTSIAPDTARSDVTSTRRRRLRRVEQTAIDEWIARNRTPATS